MIGVTGLGFFGLNIFSSTFAPVAAMLGTSSLMLAVIVGAMQNILSKSSKYSLFDPCKEMAYIPLDQESKTKGKAAIDVVGNPLGKSGGAMIQQILIFAVGSLTNATPVSFEDIPRLDLCCWCTNTFNVAVRLLYSTLLSFSAGSLSFGLGRATHSRGSSRKPWPRKYAI